MMIKIYTYKNCDTCRKATKHLKAKEIDFEEYPIRETPPTSAELEMGLKTYGGNIKRLINISSKDYREMGLKDKLPSMSPQEVFVLLQTNGNLVKRPFVIQGDTAWTGFKEDEWKSFLK
ncbi:Spx/MgsR family RNA polymerase-binding regulatory protein [bacterium]|nr:Spx/MgsR family RNA polymerase-binding regulatory protein [bacterium]